MEGDTLKPVFSDTFRISKDAIESLVEYSSDDSCLFDLVKKKAYLYGNAHVKYESMDLKAYLIVIDFNKSELYARGRVDDSTGRYVSKPLLNDGERETEADTMIYNFESKRGRTYGIAMKEGEGYILCNKVFRDNDKSIYSDEGRYTTCNNTEHPHFYLKIKNLKIIPEKKLIFGPSNLIIEDIPTPLFIPFGMIPTKKDKKSGLIPFEYGSSGNFGPYLRNIGYHFAISDYLDESITGDVYFRGSWRLASNTRYVKRYKYNGNFKFEFSKYINGEREDPDYKTNNTRTFSLGWRHNQDAKARPGSSFSANVDVQKNNAARFNSYNATTIVTNEFGSSVSYSKTLIRNRLDMRMSALHRQNTQTKYFSLTLPNLTVNMMRVTPFSQPDKNGKYKWYKDFGFSYLFEMENRIETSDSIFFSGKPVEGLFPFIQINSPVVVSPHDQFRQGMKHSLPLTLGSYKFFKQHFSFTPTVSYSEYWYFKTVEYNWDPVNEKVDTTYNNNFSRAADYSASGNLITQIFGTMQLASKKISAIRHTITPNVGFSYRPDYSKEKFGIYREYRYDTGVNSIKKHSIYNEGIKGGPQSGPSGLLTFSVGNNLQAKVLKKSDSATKYENVTWIENFSMTGNYNFLADSFKLSDLQFNAFTRLFNQVSVNANATMKPYAKRTVDGRDQYYNKLLITESGRIGNWTNAGVQLTSSINADMFRKHKSLDTSGKIKSQADRDQFADIRNNPYGYVNFDMPWSLTINYSINYTRANYVTNYNQTFSFRGDVNITPKWKVGCNSGYDFQEKKISYTQFEVSRLLHCWAINFSWIPDGLRKSFNFSLKANSSILQSLKVDKKRYWWDQ